MARLEIDGFDALNAAFGRIREIPPETTTRALSEMAEVAKVKIKAQGEAMGVRDPDSQVHILDKITTTEPKLTGSGGYADVTFSGSRQRGNTKTRNAEIAFLNEYGVESHGQDARPFIGTAMTKNEQTIAEAGAEEIVDWFEKDFMK